MESCLYLLLSPFLLDKPIIPTHRAKNTALKKWSRRNIPSSLGIMRSQFRAACHDWTFWSLRKKLLTCWGLQISSSKSFRENVTALGLWLRPVLEPNWVAPNRVRGPGSPGSWHLCRFGILWREGPWGLNPNATQTSNRNTTFLGKWNIVISEAQEDPLPFRVLQTHAKIIDDQLHQKCHQRSWGSGHPHSAQRRLPVSTGIRLFL